MKHKNIILTGFMGTGKSSVGKLLAERLGYRYCDLDALIVDAAGVSINEIFARHGEAHFRRIEAEMVRSIANRSGLVVATGGGAVLDPENRRLLRAAGFVVNLTAPAEEIFKRLHGENERPLLKEEKSLEKIGAMMEKREPFYADADIRIDTTGKCVEDVVEEILRALAA